MNAKRIKNLLTVVLTTSMVVGSTVTAFADAGVSEGTGNYEGGEMKYPTLSVTLPTIPDGTYNYIADPNGLIAATSNAKYSGATFTGDAGIFFQTEANKYTNKSAAQSFTNENAVDLDITVTLAEKEAGSDIIKYSDTDTFEATDKENKLYLAVTDGAETDPAFSAISSTAAASLTTTVAGKKDNYVANYTDGVGYGYVKKTGDLTWNSCSFNLIGALNKGAEWGDDVDFPAIKVTWSYAEHKDGPSASPASMSTAAASATISGLADGATLSSVVMHKKDGTTSNLTAGTHYTYSNNTFTIASAKASALLNATNISKFVLTYSDGTTLDISVVAAP